MTRIDLSVADTLAQINAIKREFPEILDDEDLLEGVLEGETDFHSVVAKVVTIRQDAEMMVAGMKERQSDLSARRTRFERRSAAMKRLLGMLMEGAGQKSVTVPEATISFTKGRESVEVTNVNELHQGLFREERVPLLKEIGDAIRAGEPVDGARLVQGSPTITIRKI